jgi:hypothetical protein
MNYSNQKHKRLQIIFLLLIGITIPCYGLGIAFVRINQRVDPQNTQKSVSTATFTPTPFFTSTQMQIITTRYPTFTPTETATITPTRTPSPIPTDTPTPSRTPEPSPTDTSTQEPTENPTVTVEPPSQTP